MVQPVGIHELDQRLVNVRFQRGVHADGDTATQGLSTCDGGKTLYTAESHPF